MNLRRTTFRIATVILVALSALVVPAGAQEAADPLPEDPFERLAEIRRRQAEAALEIDLLSASQREVQRRLATVEAWVEIQEQAVGRAQALLIDATLSANRAERREEAKAKELAELEQLMADIAVEAYMRPPTMVAMEVIVNHDLASAEKAEVMLRAKAQRDDRVADDLADAELALRQLRVRADQETAKASAIAEQAAAALDELNQAKYEQLALANRIQADLERTADEKLTTLVGTEADAAAEVQRATAALLARVGHGTSIDLVTVRGITVHADIGPALEGLLTQAEADGIELSGWGYRTTESQIALRRAHCGGDDAVYTASASSCSPPTAKPGTSMHELGLAVDFTTGGRTIGSQNSPAFRWMAENAEDYGFRNLPSEPWHWSINGN